MRTYYSLTNSLIRIIIILIPFFVCSCPAIDPSYTQAYYNFITLEGDLFETNQNYLIENLYGINDNGYRRKFGHEGMFNNVNYFKIDLWPASPLYIEYGNGDIDTLTVTYGPSGVNPTSEFGKLSFVKWELNGVLIADWDFKKNPELRDSILKENKSGISQYRTTFPVPVIITK